MRLQFINPERIRLEMMSLDPKFEQLRKKDKNLWEYIRYQSVRRRIIMLQSICPHPNGFETVGWLGMCSTCNKISS